VVATLPEVEETVYFIDQGQDCNIERLRGEYQTARARVLATELAEFLQKPDPDRLNYLWQAFPEGGEERGEILLVAKKYLNTSFVELKAVREILPSNEEKAAYLQKMRGKAHEYVEWESVFHICAQEGNEACRDEALGHMKSLVPVRGEEED
jgi:hypothetical protein